MMQTLKVAALAIVVLGLAARVCAAPITITLDT